MILLAAFTIFSILEIFSFSPELAIQGMIQVAMHGYSLLVIVSLYNMLLEEHKHGLTAQYTQTEKAGAYV